MFRSEVGTVDLLLAIAFSVALFLFLVLVFFYRVLRYVFLGLLFAFVALMIFLFLREGRHVLSHFGPAILGE